MRHIVSRRFWLHILLGSLSFQTYTSKQTGLLLQISELLTNTQHLLTELDIKQKNRRDASQLRKSRHRENHYFQRYKNIKFLSVAEDLGMIHLPSTGESFLQRDMGKKNIFTASNF